jgi:hypothetical protein
MKLLIFIAMDFRFKHHHILGLYNKQYPYCHVCRCDSRRGLDCILDLLTTLTQLAITLNYSAIANFQTLQFSGAHARYFPASNVFTRSWLVTATILAIPLLPRSSPLWMAPSCQLWILQSQSENYFKIDDLSPSVLLGPQSLETMTCIF